MNGLLKAAMIYPNTEITIKYSRNSGKIILKTRPFMGLSSSRTFSNDEVKGNICSKDENGNWRCNDEFLWEVLQNMIDPYDD